MKKSDTTKIVIAGVAAVILYEIIKNKSSSTSNNNGIYSQLQSTYASLFGNGSQQGLFSSI